MLYLTGSLRDLRFYGVGMDALGFQRMPGPISIIPAVAEKPLRLRQVIEQACCARVIGRLSGRHEEAQGAAVGVAEGMQLSVYATFVQPISRLSPPFNPQARCLAVRLHEVASIITVFGTDSAAARSSLIRRKAPLSPHLSHLIASRDCRASRAGHGPSVYHTTAASCG